MSDEIKTNDTENLFKVTENIFVNVSEFNNEKRIDIRRWLENKDGEKYRTRKGLNVSIDEWSDLVTLIDEINEYVHERVSKL